MFFLPGFLITLLTFPGVIVHETAHRFFCDLARVPVYEVCYFRLGHPSGYVVHGRTDRLGANFLISIGPLIVNSLLCAVISFTPHVALNLDVEETPYVFYALAWLGIAMGMHAFPSARDAQNFSQVVQDSGRRGVFYAVVKCFELLIRLANLLRVVWCGSTSSTPSSSAGSCPASSRSPRRGNGPALRTPMSAVNLSE